MPLDRASSVARRLGGLVRRMLVSVSKGGQWQVQGHEGEADSDVPVFQGIGFASRPKDGAKGAEVILCQVGGASGHPAIVALRDEDMRKAHSAVKNLGPGETVVFNHLGYAICDASGNWTLHSPSSIKLGSTATQALVRGTVYRSAEDALLITLNTLAVALQTWFGLLQADQATFVTVAPTAGLPPALAAVQTGITALITGITTFSSAAATYLSTKGKTE